MSKLDHINVNVWACINHYNVISWCVNSFCVPKIIAFKIIKSVNPLDYFWAFVKNFFLPFFNLNAQSISSCKGLIGVIKLIYIINHAWVTKRGLALSRLTVDKTGLQPVSMPLEQVPLRWMLNDMFSKKFRTFLRNVLHFRGKTPIR